ncbi:DUF4382 domain-containing protein [Paraferrimonas sp. SM1919]|uniref:DUF4382 domain-containing protein n=1 Tax=Paraferrimonas sp. SM1919 TaxID=2662263 RepID=UPI0013D6E678|nr:DUF4382 domain-containing protein [Paraferrimonas sp. SM1919]
MTFNKSKMVSALAMAGILTLTGCESDEAKEAVFSLGVSDAPVENAEEVNIELDQVKLIPMNEDGSEKGEEVIVDTFTNEAGEEVDTIQVNLLDFQGTSQIKIIDETQNIQLDAGNYEMELVVVDAGSYVIEQGDSAQQPIKIPSSRLRLGEFEVASQYVQVGDTPAYTLEFDLTQSLVQRGNAITNNGYIVKPHGVRIVSQYGDISGTVAGDYTNLGTCSVYVYAGDVVEYGDLFDANDDIFDAPVEEITAAAPLATVKVADDGSYSIGFVAPGDYQAALYCSVVEDNNVQFDGLTIPAAGEITPDVVSFSVANQESVTVNFDAPAAQ